MELKSLTLSGFRRFSDKTRLNLEGKLVALLGPNEAGKTSLLQAMSMHQSGASIPQTDHSYSSPNSPSITLSYFLSSEDAKIAGIDRRTWLHVTKKSDGALQGKLDHFPDRDLSKRAACSTAYLAAREALLAPTDLPKPFRGWKQKLPDDIAHTLTDRTDAYSRAELQKIEGLKSEIDSANFSQLPDYMKVMTELSAAIADLVQFERSHDPHQQAVQRVIHLRPKILEFTDEYRDLQLPYDIRLKNPEDKNKAKQPSKPLQELMDRVGLNLDELIAAEARKDRARRKGLLEEANGRLKTALGSWSQSDSRLEFDLEGSRLDILVQNEKGFDVRNRFKAFSTRSHGYRQFIALQIFALLKEIDGATLLIDELEQHLHYDAQADMIQLLTAEKRIGKVIYATHSAGCLPEDLASGVKLVRWKKSDQQNSEVINRFWSLDNTGGLAPLLLGMGATTMSFLPTRRALVGEGATEMLLLPRLLQEARGSETLGFQILHGLSNFNLTGIPVIDKPLAKCAFITDNDQGGESLKSRLLKAGVDKDYILSIDRFKSAITVEDLIDEAVWLEAVDTVAKQHNLALELNTAPASGRVAELPPDLQERKIDIAYTILDIGTRNPEKKLTGEGHLESLRELAEGVIALFNKADQATS
jgi:predicted ATP-dependent endonuclease of OLD family